MRDLAFRKVSRRLDDVERARGSIAVLLAPFEQDVEILRRTGFGVERERVTANHDVLNPFAGELLQ